MSAPYLWMLGEKYLTEKWSSYKWYIGFQHTIVQGVRALEFLKQEVDAGIKPQTNHFWGQEFADKKFAVMLEGSWLLIPYLGQISPRMLNVTYVSSTKCN